MSARLLNGAFLTTTFRDAGMSVNIIHVCMNYTLIEYSPLELAPERVGASKLTTVARLRLRRHCAGAAFLCIAVGIAYRACLAATGRSKSLLGRARQPLGARNQCSGVLRSHLALEVAARAGFSVFGTTRKHHPSLVFVAQTVRNHCSGVLQPPSDRNPGSGVLRSHLALEMLLEQASLYSTALLDSTTSSHTTFSHSRSTSLLERARQPLGA